jgi:transcriptional regulator with XRE-family HTH domain
MLIEDVELVIEARDLLRSGRAAELREAAGLSQRELAGMLEVSPATVNRWEAGERRPRSGQAVRLARLFRKLTAIVDARDEVAG